MTDKAGCSEEAIKKIATSLCFHWWLPLVFTEKDKITFPVFHSCVQLPLIYIRFKKKKQHKLKANQNKQVELEIKRLIKTVDVIRVLVLHLWRDQRKTKRSENKLGA